MRKFNKSTARIPLIYFILGFAWIFLTDTIVNILTQNTDLIRMFQMCKGWLFVLLSTAVIYVLLRRHDRHYEMERTKREQVFHKTVQGSCHIILNYLNQMKLISLEAEKFDQFDHELLEEADHLGDRALNLLKELDEIEDVESDAIDALLYRDLKKSD